MKCFNFWHCFLFYHPLTKPQLFPATLMLLVYFCFYFSIWHNQAKNVSNWVIIMQREACAFKHNFFLQQKKKHTDCNRSTETTPVSTLPPLYMLANSCWAKKSMTMVSAWGWSHLPANGESRNHRHWIKFQSIMLISALTNKIYAEDDRT